MSVPSMDRPPEGAPSERVLEGSGVAPGIAIGRVFCHQPSAPTVERDRVAPADVDKELSLLDDAMQRAEQEIEQVRLVARQALGEEGSSIFEAQRMMLRDESLIEAVRERIRTEQSSAGRALQVVLEQYRNRLRASDDPYLRGRADDLVEIEDRLLRVLQQGKTVAQIEPNTIVVADTLSAADLIRFHERGLLGCVTTTGGATSHVSILARALSIPAVVGAEGALKAAETEAPAILDGTHGRVVFHPSSDTLSTYRRRRARLKKLRGEQEQARAEPAETTDGNEVTVRANVEFGEQIDGVEASGAEGIGLLRTEMLFLGQPEASLSEDRQATLYRRAAEATAPHPATVRLLDLGGDKQLLGARPETNPALGWRGVRLLLDRVDELLRPQIRALLRANAYGPVHALLPMVGHLEEVCRVRSVLADEADRLAAEGMACDPDLPLGVMVEVPATALRAESFAEVADVLAIGTNDLTQYVLAVDRANPRVANRYDAMHPAVLHLVRRVVAAGLATGTPVSLCGELAGDLEAVPVLVGLGVSILSVPPSRVPAVKQLVKGLALSDAEGLAQQASAAPDAETARQHARRWLDAHLNADLQDRNEP